MIINTNGVNVDTQKTNDEILNIASSSPIPSYLAFVGNVNADSVASAFGKNNEDEIKGVGKALSMYEKYKGGVALPNLEKYSTLNDMVSNAKDIVEEIYGSRYVEDLIKSSSYALGKLSSVIPFEGQNSVVYGTTAYNAKSFTVPEHLHGGKYRIVGRAKAGTSYSAIFYISVNGATIATSPQSAKGATVTLTADVKVNAGDVISFSANKDSYVDYWYGIYLFSAKETECPKNATPGDETLFVDSCEGKSFTITESGIYRLKLSTRNVNNTSDSTKGVHILVNDTTVLSATSTSVTTDMELAVGDVVKFSYNTSYGYVGVGFICVADNPNAIGVPK